jgi:FMN phosphatase YigB (HAD superfamily)
MKKNIKHFARGIQTKLESLAYPSLGKAYRLATKAGLFDSKWYQEHYGSFPSDWLAFKDYINKSPFANVNPSPEFDTETYLRSNVDIYHAGISPLLHYMYHGRYENRAWSKALPRWAPRDNLIPKESTTWRQQKIAIVLHIFYPDFVAKFASCLEKFPTNVDVFVTAATQEIADNASSVFTKITRVNKVSVATCENRGRNFGPFLVHFSKELLDYDLMCHLHSKKSLYSGREQTQWFDYQNQFLLKDKHVTSSVLRLFDEHLDLGLYYPTSFWMMPAWVNHWTCNKPFAKEFVDEWGLDISDNFLSYPVGGMFWARPQALKPLLDKTYQYEDFPEEPLPNDGSKLHALERILGPLAEKQGFEQFYYYPPLGRFTQDKTSISSSYYKPASSLLGDLVNFDIVSFDVFDTVLRRKYYEPDYAKYLLGKELTNEQFFDSPEKFVEARNKAEFTCREAKQFQGDVCITEVYTQLAEDVQVSGDMAQAWMNKEFYYDLQMSMPKDEMVEIVKQLSLSKKEIWFITDIYYTKQQVETMLRKIGIAVPYRLFVSSDLGKRKDAGTMWSHIKELIAETAKSYIHVGDNVRSDAQICGDFGLQNIHILNPIDKWKLAGLSRLTPKDSFTENDTLKWGPQISHLGRYPFFGE